MSDCSVLFKLHVRAYAYLADTLLCRWFGQPYFLLLVQALTAATTINSAAIVAAIRKGWFLFIINFKMDG